MALRGSEVRQFQNGKLPAIAALCISKGRVSSLYRFEFRLFFRFRLLPPKPVAIRKFFIFSVFVPGPKSVSVRSNLWGSSKSWSLKHKNGVFIENCDMGRGNSFVLKAFASVAAAQKLSTVPEIEG
ncbi:3-phosphoshikimate 1-carboxyvinyltransferase [Trifolium repens]|nr:3-phosphoshikimate 1-carboxyvinyltransferase [Trifolium repens]